MTKKRERDGSDDNAPAVVITDATERHLSKARELLREAQSRLSSRDAAAIDVKRDEKTNGDDEDSSG
jgi:hypothetical protein